MVPAINSEDYLNQQREKRRIKAKQFSDYQCSNIVEKCDKKFEVLYCGQFSNRSV